MHKHSILAPQLLPHLPDRLEKRQRFDVADGPANLHNRDVALGCYFTHRVPNLVRHVRDHLHGFSQIIPAPLLGDDLLVDAPRRQIVIAG